MPSALGRMPGTFFLKMFWLPPVRALIPQPALGDVVLVILRSGSVGDMRIC